MALQSLQRLRMAGLVVKGVPTEGAVGCAIGVGVMGQHRLVDTSSVAAAFQFPAMHVLYVFTDHTLHLVSQSTA